MSFRFGLRGLQLSCYRPGISRYLVRLDAVLEGREHRHRADTTTEVKVVRRRKAHHLPLYPQNQSDDGQDENTHN